MPAKMVATHGTVGDRKAARRQVRNLLGTSREDAPEVQQAITAAQHLEKILHDASGGELTLVIEHTTRGPLNWRQAREMARGE
jgi:hypothetical protein